MSIKSIGGYTRRFIRANKKQMLLSFGCTTLCLSSVLLLTSLAYSYFTSLHTFELLKYGEQDAVIHQVTKQKAAQAKEDPAFTQVGSVKVFGNQKIPENAYGNYMTAGYLDEAAKRLTHIELKEGSWPKQSGDAVLEESLSYQLGVSVGDAYTLHLSLLGSDVTVQKTIRVTGICGDYASTQSPNEKTQELAGAFPNIVVLPEFSQAELRGEAPVQHLVLKLRNRHAGEKRIKNLLSDYAQGDETSIYSRWFAGAGAAQESQEDAAELSVNYIFLIAAGFAVFVILLSLCFNAYAAQKRNAETLLQLKLAGASVGDIVRFFFFRECWVNLASLPFSMLISGVLLWIFSKKILVRFTDVFSLHFHSFLLAAVLLLALVLSFAFLYLSIRQELKRLPFQRKKKRGRKTSAFLNRDLRTKQPSLLLGIKSAVLYRKRTFSIFCLLALSITVFLSGEIVSKAVIRDLKEEIALDYKLEEYNGSYVSLLEIPVKLNYGFSEKDMGRLVNNPELEVLTRVKQFRVKLITKERKEQSGIQYYLEDYSSIDSSALKRDKEMFGYREDDYLMPTQIVGVDEPFLKRLEPYVKEGAIDKAGLAAAKSIIVFRDSGNEQFHAGDTVTFTQTLWDPPGGFTGDFTASRRYDKQFSVCAVVDLSRAGEADLREISRVVNRFVTLNAAFDAFPFPTNYCNAYARLVRTDQYGETQALLKELQAIYPNMSIQSKQAEATKLRLLVAATQAVFEFVMLLLSSFAVFTMVHTLQRKLEDQKKTYAVLRAMGFSMGRAVWAQAAEFSLYLVPAAVAGIFLSFPVQLIFNAKSLFLTYPWGLAAGAAMLLCLLVLLFSIIPLRRMYKKNLAELLR